MRRNMWMLASLVVGLLLAGCATPNGSAAEPSGPAPGSAPTTADPLALIGLWTITEADEEKEAALRLASPPAGLTLFRACGYLVGSWRASTDGMFVAHTFAGHDMYERGAEGPPVARCGSGPDAAATPSWLRRVAGFRPDGEAQLLLDEDGGTVARLLPGARPSPGPNLAPQEATPPEVDDAARRSLAPASPLPANLRPAGESDLLGRWVPAGTEGNGKGFAEFVADRGWRGSDGCNGLYGRWVPGPAGTLLATDGPSTLIGCDNAPIGSWLAQTYRAGFDGDVLVLLDQAKELGRLRRG